LVCLIHCRWKALDFAALERSSVSFFNDEKPETAVSRWARARTRAAKVPSYHFWFQQINVLYFHRETETFRFFLPTIK